MTRPGRPCPRPGCPNLAPCPEHRHQKWATSTRRAELPPDWAKLRKRRLTLDRHTCQRCGAPGTEVHHRVHRDDHRIESLETLCRACHKAETDLERAAAHPSRRRAT